jgi:hypothetical protein
VLLEQEVNSLLKEAGHEVVVGIDEDKKRYR